MVQIRTEAVGRIQPRGLVILDDDVTLCEDCTLDYAKYVNLFMSIDIYHHL